MPETPVSPCRFGFRRIRLDSAAAQPYNRTIDTLHRVCRAILKEEHPCRLLRFKSGASPGAHAFFLGAFLALLALTPAILPYGGRFVTRGDFIEQQLPFILETRRILRSGLNSYSFNTFLGAPAVGSYAFYTLGSVFVWPLALLPKALIPFGISVMAVLKHAVCALTSFCYLRRMVKEERLALLGSVLYTFSAFTIVNTQFYHFLEVIAFFPLILLGMEDAMSDHPRRGLLALFCGLNTLTNYYFMLSSALLAALYFVFRFFSADWKPRRTFKNVFMLIFECGAAARWQVCCSCRRCCSCSQSHGRARRYLRAHAALQCKYPARTSPRAHHAD